MKKTSYLLRLVLLAVLSVSSLATLERAGAQTAGQEQTPIDIRDEDVTFDPQLPALAFGYGTKVTLNVVNSGSPGEFATVRAELPLTNTDALTVGGVTYRLLQFHWHAPSEHELNGRKFPMEMHLVHKFAEGTPDEVISVVGVFVRAGKENKELKKLFADLPQVKDETRAVKNFNLTRLLPESLESYRYRGSLTTPDFNEGVRWVVLAEPIEMSQEQIEAFRQLFPEGNSREIQPLNGRTVLTDVAPEGD